MKYRPCCRGDPFLSDAYPTVRGETCIAVWRQHTVIICFSDLPVCIDQNAVCRVACLEWVMADGVPACAYTAMYTRELILKPCLQKRLRVVLAVVEIT